MKVECTDLMDPRLVYVGTISRVVGRLLKVVFFPSVDLLDKNSVYRFILMAGKKTTTSGWTVRVSICIQ